MNDGSAISNGRASSVTDRSPEELFWMLLTVELPDATSLKELRQELQARCNVPSYVFDALRCLPKSSHPMAMQSMGLLMLEEGSKFRAQYNEGMSKDHYWEATLEDSLDLLAKIPALTAGVYRIHTPAPPDDVQMPTRRPLGNFSSQAMNPTAKSSI